MPTDLAETLSRFLASHIRGDLGAHPQDSGIFFYAIIRPKLADTGKHICIDSISNFPSIHPWRWRSANYSPGFSTYPTWNGPFCFVLASSCCWGVTGNVDCDPADGTDISDLSGLIDNLYISFGPLCCKQAANIDGSLDGNVDISDLTALIDHLYISFTSPAPCR